ncbi:MAG: alpha-amylase family glycosyl hydrolase [Bacteroidota bacterium]
MLHRLCLLALLLTPAAALAQGTLDVTFRFLPDLASPEIEPVVRAFLPGEFNDWGPNDGGQIDIGAPSLMTYDADENEYRYTVALTTGQSYEYKVHYQQNQAGTNWVWITDPLNPLTDGSPFNDSVVEVADPMVFQLAREENATGQIAAVSAGIFGTEAIEELQFQVNDGPLQDGLAFLDTETGLFRYTLPEPTAAPGFLRVVAEDALGRSAEAEIGIVPPDVVDAARPDGLEDGITYVDGSTVRLSLFAPFKNFVHVVGDFNDWTADAASLMRRDADAASGADSVWWWIELDGLTPGEPVAFQYLIDGDLRIADPYSALVLTTDDEFIPDAAFPNLPPYPSEAAGRPATLITPGATPYDWQVNDFERPAQEELVIYELLVRDFIAAHDYDTLADTLDYLDRLGVNAIELMPVAEFGGNLNWGYQPTFHLALDKYYGPPEQFKAFVDAAHARGIAVLLDVVYNHADGPSPLVDLYGCTEASLYANSPARHPFNVFCDLDHTSPAVQAWLDRANRWWVEEYRVDGYRFDLSKGFMQTGPWDGFNPERIGLLTRMADALWAVDDDALIILEHLNPSAQENLELVNFGRDRGLPGMMLWNKMTDPYNESTMGYLDGGSDLSSTYPPQWIGGMPVAGAVTYMESHDEQWMMFKNRTFGNSAGSYDITDLNTALDRQKLAGAFFFTVPGARMMWQFGEVGYGGGPGECLKPGDGSNGDCPAFAPSRTGPKPIRWNYADEPDRRNLYETWAALINLRNDYALFTSPDTEVTLEVGNNDATRSITLTLADAPDGEPSAAVIVGNFGLQARDIAQAFPASGTWYEFFTDTERELSGTNASVVLDPGFARVFTDVDVPSPAGGIYVVDDEAGPGTPLAFGLDAAYPNPFASAATIGYTLAAPSAVRLEVYDVLGRRVAVLADGLLPAGTHRAVLDGSSLPSGTYVVRLTAGADSATQKLLLLR